MLGLSATIEAAELVIITMNTRSSKTFWKLPVTAHVISSLSPLCLEPPSSAAQFQGCRGCRPPVLPSFCPPALAANNGKKVFKGSQSND